MKESLEKDVASKCLESMKNEIVEFSKMSIKTMSQENRVVIATVYKNLDCSQKCLKSIDKK